VISDWWLVIGGVRLPNGPTFSQRDWFFPIMPKAKPILVLSRGLALGHGSARFSM
jgi:hypothetical protein